MYRAADAVMSFTRQPPVPLHFFIGFRHDDDAKLRLILLRTILHRVDEATPQLKMTMMDADKCKKSPIFNFSSTLLVVFTSA